MSTSGNVVALLAEQNSETAKSGKCLTGQKDKTAEQENKTDVCAADEAGRRKKRVDTIQQILKSELKCKKQGEGFGTTSLLTEEEDIGAKHFGIKQKRDGLPSVGLPKVDESGLGKIGRRQGKRDRKVGNLP